MQRKDIKKTIDEIERRISTGETVNVNVEAANSDAQLAVDSGGARKITSPAKKSSHDKTAGITENDASPERTTVSLNLKDADSITDAQIVIKIEKAVEHSRDPSASASAVAGDLPLVVLTRDEARQIWILYQRCSYQTDSHLITAPTGYETDLASIPRIFWSILEPAELSLAAPLFHDMIYRCGGKLPADSLQPSDGKIFTRKEVDDLFLELMTKAGIPKWKRKAAYYAVRGFASFAWKSGS